MTKESLTREHTAIRCRECLADRPLFARLVDSYTKTLSSEQAEAVEGLSNAIAETADDPLRLGWIYAGCDESGSEEFYCSEGCALQ